MGKDIGSLTFNFNLYSLENFGLGFDYYKTYDWQTEEVVASILMFSFLFFNVTIAFWKKGIKDGY